MSRVGGRPIEIPSGIKIDIQENTVKVEGKGKTLEYIIPDGFTAELKDNQLIITRPGIARHDEESYPEHGDGDQPGL